MEDRAQYLKYLEHVVKIGYDEYKLYSLDLMKFQFDHIKTYIWISSAFAGGVVAVGLRILSGELNKNSGISIPIDGDKGWVVLLLASLSVALSFSCTCIGILAMRGSGKKYPIVEKFFKLCSLAHKDVEAECDGSYFIKIACKIDTAYESAVAERGALGKSIRLMGWLMTFSIVTSLTSLFVLAFWQFN